MKPIDPTQLRGLSAAILSDVMDSLGLTRRAMRPFVRPLDDELVLVGRARTGLYMSSFSLRDGENPYEVEIALVDDLQPGDVVVLACNGPTDRIAPWGELLSTASVARKAARSGANSMPPTARQTPSSVKCLASMTDERSPVCSLACSRTRRRPARTGARFALK